MSSHITTCGWIYAIFGGLGIMGCLTLEAVAVFAAVSPESMDFQTGEEAMVFATMFGVMGCFGLVMTGIQFLAGYGLIKRRRWAYVPALIISGLQLLSIPIGTLIGGYCLWALLSAEGKASWEREAS